jgi:hypothetical protein
VTAAFADGAARAGAVDISEYGSFVGYLDATGRR